MISFNLRIDNETLIFTCIPVSPEWENFIWIFSTRTTGVSWNISFYEDLLKEISKIDKGEIEINEECVLRDFSPSGDLIIKKDLTILQIPEERKFLKIPTKEFKNLIENWIKFVKINSEAFGSHS